MEAVISALSYTPEIASLLLAVAVAYQLDQLSHPPTFAVGSRQPFERTVAYQNARYFIPVWGVVMWIVLKSLSRFVDFGNLSLIHYFGLVVLMSVCLFYCFVTWVLLFFDGPLTPANPALTVELYRQRMLLSITVAPILVELALIIYTNVLYQLRPPIWIIVALFVAYTCPFRA